MSTTLRDFIANREGEIRDQIKALKSELKELQLAKAALDGQDAAPAPAQSSGPTIKDMARTVLNTGVAKNGLTSHEILAGIKVEFDRDIDRTSLSPQLSRLKADGEIALDGEKWFTTDNYAEWRRRLVAASLGVNIFATDKPDPEEEDDDSAPF